MMRASGADRFSRTTYFETAVASVIVSGTLAATVSAAGRRRVLHVLDGVDDVVRRQLLAVVELDALAQVEGDRFFFSDFHDVARAGLMFRPLSNSASES